MPYSIRKPVFIVGFGRSGTTILYNLLAGHPDLGWLSNYNERIPNFPCLSVLSRVYGYPWLGKRFGHMKGFPKPIEGYGRWKYFHPEDNAEATFKTTLGAKDASGMDRERMISYISRVLKYSGTTCLLMKTTRNTLRIPYLYALFPEAYFIHILRDGRAVTNSLLKVDWWPNINLWWANERHPHELEMEGMDRYTLAARHWAKSVQKAIDDLHSVPPSQYLEIRYEDLTKNPIDEIHSITEFCGLPWTPRFEAHLKSFNISSQNYKWMDDLCPEKVKMIEKECGQLLAALSYE